MAVGMGMATGCVYRPVGSWRHRLETFVRLNGWPSIPWIRMRSDGSGSGSSAAFFHSLYNNFPSLLGSCRAPLCAPLCVSLPELSAFQYLADAAQLQVRLDTVGQLLPPS